MSAAGTYLFTPFLSSSLTYQHSERQQGGIDTLENVFMFNVKYSPY